MSDYLTAALDREGRDFYRGHPDFTEEVPDANKLLGRSLTAEQRARFDDSYEIDEAGCWLWTRNLDTYGYGKFCVGSWKQAHRVAYRLLVGPIGEGLTVDHLCRVRRCVNPEHMELVTLGENIRRGNSPWGMNARKTHCKHGHEFTPENTYWRPDRPGQRECIACRRSTEGDAVSSGLSGAAENPERGMRDTAGAARDSGPAAALSQTKPHGRHYPAFECPKCGGLHENRKCWRCHL